MTERKHRTDHTAPSGNLPEPPEIVLPAVPPQLTPGAARALLRVLGAAHRAAADPTEPKQQ